MAVDPENVTIVEEVSGSDIPVELKYIETWDGLYAPIGLRIPPGPDPHPLVLLASGNGGGGMAWIRDAVANRGYIMERLLERGYACAWIRYRTEVELGYETGGRLIRDTRQGRDMFNRSPLEYEDEIAIVEQLKEDPRIDADRVGLIGMSHGGEMVLKIASEYHGVAAAVASEPASHEFLSLNPDNTAFVDPDTGLRNIEEMQMVETDKVRSRIDMAKALDRIAPIDTPILVMGREDDHLQGIFRTSYDLLAEQGKPVDWVSWDHELHGYVFPQRGPDGDYQVNDVQEKAIAGVLSFLDKHLRP
ncbi:MAG TPA: prolyl oligopeptidase family serine peptidase [Acidimicrobiia bacterium]|jgi:dipeptidyl aminopeptidase/acylaminoacyl peptidase|nr:prolyl oligopeptidase family serine peptidase [Acidimicrobiia bacterium]